MEDSKLRLWELKAQEGTKSWFCVAPSSMQDPPSMWDPPSVWDPSPMWESSYLWWWFPGYIHTLKIIIKTLYALNMCSLVYISYTSIKLFIKTRTCGKDGQQTFAQSPCVLWVGFPGRPTLSGNSTEEASGGISWSDPMAAGWEVGLAEGEAGLRCRFSQGLGQLPGALGEDSP